MKTIWLTVDWDFFQEERVEWDWSHAERGKMYSELVWPTRAFFGGEDIRPITHPNRHAPGYADFWKLLERADFNAAQEIAVAGSHAMAWPYFHRLSGDGVPDELWNFDAHHDLGYTRLQTLRSWVKEEKAEAGSWGFALLKKFRALRYRHIRPRWRDLNAEPTPWIGEASVAKRVTRISASEFVAEPVRVTGIFIAKSEAWSPPWNDGYFTEFLEAGAEATGLPLAVYGDDVTHERLVDEGAVQALGRFIAGQVSAHEWLKRSEFTDKEKP